MIILLIWLVDDHKISHIPVEDNTAEIENREDVFRVLFSLCDE